MPSLKVWALLGVLGTGLALATGSLVIWLVRRPSGSSATPEPSSPLAGSAAGATPQSAPAPASSEPEVPAPAAGTVLMAQPDAAPVEKTVLLSQQGWLKMVEGPAPGTVFTLSDRAASSIGRSPGNEILLNESAVSGQHCRIRFEEGQFVVHDLGSTNGTLVNDQRIEKKHALKSGDQISVGTIRLQFGIGVPPSQA
jgi:hypothetical protein